MDILNKGESVLVIWETGNKSEKLKEFVEECKKVVGDTGKIYVENAQRLSMASLPASSVDAVLSGLHPQEVRHDVGLLGEVVRVLRPRGRLVLQEVLSAAQTRERLLSVLTMSGLARPTSVRAVPLPPEEPPRLEVRCAKPDFEVGSSAKLSFPGAVTQRAEVAAVWKLDDTVDDDIETMDPDELLDDDDLKKPDPGSLRVCATSGKRKACKNCSCGLAEELAAGGKPAQKTATSSCGSCYLGDAFRCASCPYLGMPAFKPGEKVQLAERQLRADV
ncbi:anamorsin homolog [Bacillus rossius redtenbacheri]|uniref:anamorsin homolog n=1 Tax=Bacillus rossius redtenbacheri TaxID=93214 RepID=UPI002FDD791C